MDNKSSNRVRYFVDQNYRVMDRQVNGVIARCATAEDAGTIAFSLNYTARRASGSSDETSPDSRDAARYRWLRQARAVYDDSGRFPQGEALDECCDAFMAKNQDGRQSDEPTLQGGFGPTVREPSSAQSSFCGRFYAGGGNKHCGLERGHIGDCGPSAQETSREWRCSCGAPVSSQGAVCGECGLDAPSRHAKHVLTNPDGSRTELHMLGDVLMPPSQIHDEKTSGGDDIARRPGDSGANTAPVISAPSVAGLSVVGADSSGKASEQPPVDNDHVAPGCEKFHE